MEQKQKRRKLAGEDVKASCPVCQPIKFAVLNKDLETATMFEHLSPTGNDRCDGSGNPKGKILIEK